MAGNSEDVALDRVQVKKAVQALQAFLKDKSTTNSLLLDEGEQISLLFTLWVIPKKAQSFHIPLPHSFRTSTDEVCLFTRDEPRMTPDQTQRFYNKILAEGGVQNITKVIAFKTLRTEYKPFEAKRRLEGNFNVFLSDKRIHNLLPAHLGKHFYERKKMPLSVNLQSKTMAVEFQQIIQGTKVSISNKGCCCMVRVAHSGMTADQILENIQAAVKTFTSKHLTTGQPIKLIHLKSHSSLALPIYSSDLRHLPLIKEVNEQIMPTKADGSQSSNKKKQKLKEKTDTPTEMDEEIPELVPIATPSKKAKLEKLTQRGLEKVPKPTGGKKVIQRKGRMTKSPGKNPTRKRKGKVFQS